MIRLDDPVITARLLEERLGGGREVEIAPASKVTPLARDYLREHGIRVVEARAGGSVPA